MSSPIVTPKNIQCVLVGDASSPVPSPGNPPRRRNRIPTSRLKIKLVKVRPVAPIVTTKHIHAVRVDHGRVRVARRRRNPGHWSDARPVVTVKAKRVKIGNSRSAVEAGKDVKRVSVDHSNVPIAGTRRNSASSYFQPLARRERKRVKIVHPVAAIVAPKNIQGVIGGRRHM